MKNFIKIILLASFTILITEVAYANNTWSLFVKKANADTYSSCQNMINESLVMIKKGDSYTVTPLFLNLVSNDNLYNDFLNLVENRNHYAMELAIQLYPFTCAATREVLCQAIASTIEKDPIFFLFLLNKYKINDDPNQQKIEHYTLSTPITKEIVDHPIKRVDILKKRLKSLETVSNPELMTVKTKCINILSDYLKARKKENEMS
jgi:hypothetical protein